MISKTILLAGLAVFTAAGTTMVSANEPTMPKGERAFNFLDTNKDGKVTIDEMKPKAQKRVLRLDNDKDNAVTAAEIDVYLTGQLERRKGRLLSHLDADKDGKITVEEVDRFVEVLFNGTDSDHDGAVTVAEAREKAGKRWKPLAAQGN